MDGHGVQVGGVIVDSGNFDWEAQHDKFTCLTEPDASYHGLRYTEAFGKLAYITKATAQLMRDLGSIQSPQNAFYLHLGLQTLHVRMPRHCESAHKVAQWLEKHPDIAWVRYPELENDPEHARQQKYMPNGSCGVMAFAVKGDRAFANRFMDSLQLVTIETHVADCHTCILHPASHTHRHLSNEALLAAGIDPDQMRLSIGLENADDLIADIENALTQAHNA